MCQLLRHNAFRGYIDTPSQKEYYLCNVSQLDGEHSVSASKQHRQASELDWQTVLLFWQRGRRDMTVSAAEQTKEQVAPKPRMLFCRNRYYTIIADSCCP